MRIGRVVDHAPRRPDSPSPCIYCLHHASVCMMLLCVNCHCAVFDYIYLLFNSNLRSKPERVADFLVSKLTGWLVSFYVGSGDWGSGMYGIVEPLPAIVMVAGGISRAKLVLFVRVYF
eukprot:1157574-Pelagomonas_calceolata.AAC.1